MRELAGDETGLNVCAALNEPPETVRVAMTPAPLTRPMAKPDPEGMALASMAVAKKIAEFKATLERSLRI